MSKKMIGQWKHCKEREENDFYATDPNCVRDLLKHIYVFDKTVLEPCAGNGHISNVLLEEAFANVYTNDLIDRGVIELDCNCDFLKEPINTGTVKFDYVITNPPFKHSLEFVLKSFEYSDKVIIFEKLSFLESIKRHKELFSKGYLECVLVYSKRQVIAKNGDFELHKNANAIAFAWFIFDKNNKNEPTIKWV